MRTQEEIEEYLSCVYKFSYIPVYYFEEGTCVWNCQAETDVMVPEAIRNFLWKETKGIQVAETVIHSFYGKISLEKERACIIIGPVKPTIYVPDDLRKFMFQYHIEKEKQDIYAKQFQNIPMYELLQFHFLLKQTGMYFCPGNQSISTYHDMGPDNYKVESFEKNREKEFEMEKIVNLRAQREIYNPLIREGNIESLIKRSTQSAPVYYGEYSNDLVKNQLIIMIITVTNTMNAAVEGGLQEQEAYLLVRHYVNLALKAKTAAEVDEISMRCSMHLVEQVRKYKDRNIIHTSLYECVQFVRNNLYAPIKVSDVAAYAGYSEAHLSRKFKKELGFGAAEFIYRCKLEEAKTLLETSNQSVGEISESLYFANQSHFQRKFKEKYGKTPLKYRNDYKKMF